MQNLGPVVSEFRLEALGLEKTGDVYWNLPVPQLYEHAIARKEVRLGDGGTVVAVTGRHTGRAPNDKFIVKDALTENSVWWGKVNKPISQDNFRGLLAKARAYCRDRQLYVLDCHAGADPAFRLNVRVVTDSAWHCLFARNMFRRTSAAEQAVFQPGFTVLHLPGLEADPATDGTRTGTFIIVDFTERLILIGGTHYAGEIKKSIFGILNYLLPEQGVMPMHCSANVGPAGDVAVFFGLSGTGKTTLSADASRTLIGDDEHGWSDNGVFNFEGGCYAKVIRLSAKAEPEIYATTSRFGTVLENVVLDDATGRVDLDDGSITENTRASYPLDFIPNASETGMATHPDSIIMLTADAFGVLPPISRLTPEQAMYHFLSGYTARVAGTEEGVTEPQATFSTCFGAPFMPRHPTVYAKLLGEKIARHGTRCWLVNTGWSGGRYGEGERMSIAHTRAMVRAALDGKLAEVSATPEPCFGLAIPEACPDVPADVLQPRSSWQDKAAYDATAQEVARRFEANFEQFQGDVADDVMAAGIHAAA